MEYVVETNVLIDYVANRFSAVQLERLDDLFDKALNVSIITKIESLGFNGSDFEMNKMLLLFNVSNVFPLDNNIADRTIEIKKVVKIKTPDAIIAATALVHEYTILTRNISDFKSIQDLKIENPWEW